MRSRLETRSHTVLTPRAVRTAVVAAVALLVIPLLLRPATPAPDVAATHSVDGVVIPVASLERAVDFYSKVLSFERVGEGELAGDVYDRLLGVPALRARVARMRLGRETIELVEYVTPRGRPVPRDSRSQDHWFQHVAIIVNDMEQAYLWLRRHGVERTSPEPQRLPDWNPNAGGIWAFYFKDPDGHALEILQFPADKGAARWQEPSDKIFLGIDHTAIVVADTERSLRLYRDVLGMKVGGRSENYGPEQERLNNVAGARLRITTLRASSGPGVELLEYLAPRDGRPLPAAARLNDLIGWRTVLTVSSSATLAGVVDAPGVILMSTRVLTVPVAAGSARDEVVIRDPDGHALHLRLASPDRAR